jgi:hypothetical protein
MRPLDCWTRGKAMKFSAAWFAPTPFSADAKASRKSTQSK